MLNTEQLVEKTIEISVNKARTHWLYLFLKACIAGIFVVLGVIARNAAVYCIDNDSLARILGGLFFPIGFIFIVFLGGELFTGNSLMIMAVLDKKISFKNMLRNLGIVYVGNLLGTLIGIILIYFSGVNSIGDGELGLSMIEIARNKASLSNEQLFFSAVMCNIFVSGAILMITVVEESAAKFLVSWFTICTFGIIGFEHIVVNMYYMMVAYPKITIIDIIRNFTFVTAGNILGGSVFLGTLLYYIQKCK